METLLETAQCVLMGVGLVTLLVLIAVADALFHRDDEPPDG